MPQLLDYPRYAWQVWRGDRSRGEADLDASRRADLAGLVDFSRRLTILDLANGRLRPQYAILRAQGHRVIGIDLVNRPEHAWKGRAYAVARALYADRLRLPPSAMRPDTLVCGDVGRLPFPDATFDLVTSVAAFEHFLDVPAVVAEVARVLKPGGVVWTAIHVFTAPSGGHNLSFAEVPLRHVPPGVEPWDHLRQRRLPFSVPLNEWRIRDYLAAFARHFVHLQETFSDVVKTDKTGLSKTAHTRWMISAFANFLPGSTIFRLA